MPHARARSLASPRRDATCGPGFAAFITSYWLRLVALMAACWPGWWRVNGWLVAINLGAQQSARRLYKTPLPSLPIYTFSHRDRTSRAHSTSALPFLLSSFRRSECTGSRKSRPPKLRPSPETLHPRSRRAIKFLGSASLRDCSLLPNDYFLVAQLHCEHLHCIDC